MEPVKINSVKNIKKYDWPNDGDISEIWRHVSDYIIYDIATNQKVPITEKRLIYNEPSYRLEGNIIPPPKYEGEVPIIRVTINILKESIDFGLDINDTNRGLWFESSDGIWYKLERPHRDYYQTALTDILRVAFFRNLYDILIFGSYTQKVLAESGGSKCTCNYTIEEVYKLSNRAFSLRHIKKNASFYYDHLSTKFKSKCPFMFSLANLIPDNISQEVIIILFKIIYYLTS